MNINYFKEQLLKEKAELSAMVHDMELNSNSQNSSGDLSSYDNHPADMGTEVYMDEMQNSLKNREVDRLYNINHALDKIQNNTYGICDECGSKIEEERLDIIPESATCSKCANTVHPVAQNYNSIEKTDMFKGENFYSDTIERLSEVNHANTEEDLDNDY